MKLFRKILFWSHLIVGVSVAMVVLTMSVTGVLLTYKVQITNWSDFRSIDGSPPSADAVHLGAGELLELIEDTELDVPRSIIWSRENHIPLRLLYGRSGDTFVNAYTGKILRPNPSRVRAFFRSVEDWHRWLALSDDKRMLGRSITGVANLGFFFLALSGAYLWWPRNLTWRAFRQVMWFKRRLSPKARDFNWHNVIGFWSVIPLLFIVGSAVVISYSWADELLYSLVDEEDSLAVAQTTDGGGLEDDIDEAFLKDEILFQTYHRLSDLADSNMPSWKTMALEIPRSRHEPLKLVIDRGTGRQATQQADLILDRESGEELAWLDFKSKSSQSKVNNFVRFSHTGEFFGFWGQTLAGLVSLGSVLMIWTGLWLSWRRMQSWRWRRKK